ncbi:MAG: LysE family transporter, partial [Pseudomonadota bacterium]
DLGIEEIGQKSGAERFLGARGAIDVNFINPKVGLFYLAFLPAFADPAAGALWPQILFLGAVFSAGGVLVLTIVAFAAGRLRNRLVRSTALRARVRAGAAVLIGGLGLHLLFSRNP